MTVTPGLSTIAERPKAHVINLPFTWELFVHEDMNQILLQKFRIKL